MAVIMIHIAGPNMYHHLFSGTWWMANGLDTISRFAVPLFLMISGALLLHKEEQLGVFARKRAIKIAVPFLGWSLVYYVLAYGLNGTILGFGKEMIGTSTHYHLWYFNLIIPLYFFIPLLRKVVAHIPLSYIWYYALVSAALSTVTKMISWMGGDLKVYENPFSTGVAFLLLGYAITHREMKIRYLNWAGTISIGVIFTGTYLLCFHDQAFNGILYDALGLFVMMQTVMIFAFVYQKQDAFNRIGQSMLIRLLSVHSFGIYLIHPIVIDFLLPFFPKAMFTLAYGYIGYVAFFITVLAGSFLSVWLMSKIPIIKMFV